MKALLISVMILCLVLGVVIVSQAASVTMNRNTEPDMAWYRAFTCVGSNTCVPSTALPSMDIQQPATGNPTKVIPPTASGRICYEAEDSVGNQSACSNTVPFRGQPLSAPSGLQQIP